MHLVPQSAVPFQPQVLEEHLDGVPFGGVVAVHGCPFGPGLVFSLLLVIQTTIRPIAADLHEGLTNEEAKAAALVGP